MNALKSRSLKLSSDLKALDQVLAQFDELYEPFISKKIWIQCQLALAEGFTNAVRHAHRDLPPETPVEVEIKLFPDYLELRIWDSGPPFDLEGKIQQLPPVVEHGATGGRGLPILDRIADQLTYRRTEDQRNCLYLFKKLESV